MPAAREPEIFEVDTPYGAARVHLHRPAGRAAPAGLLMLGHGAGGGIAAADLTLARDVGLDHRLAVALVEQPYRVAGRRAPAPAKQVDAAWIAVAAAMRKKVRRGPLIVGGRSFGARVACRTAAETGAGAVLCLAFPLHPPGRPQKSRQDELSAVDVPTLIVQGERDPFGRPEPPARGEIVVVKGDHGLKSDAAAIRAAIDVWLAGLSA